MMILKGILGENMKMPLDDSLSSFLRIPELNLAEIHREILEKLLEGFMRSS